MSVSDVQTSWYLNKEARKIIEYQSVVWLDKSITMSKSLYRSRGSDRGDNKVHHRILLLLRRGKWRKSSTYLASLRVLERRRKRRKSRRAKKRSPARKAWTLADGRALGTAEPAPQQGATSHRRLGAM